jgi:predicted nucleotidyltransferase
MAHPNLTSDENKAIAELKEVLEKLLDNRLMIFNLYGSKAKGDYGNESDTDIAIIVRGLSKKQKKQIFNVIADIEVKYFTPLSVLLLSDKDFESLKRKERRISLDIERDGIPL